MSTPKQRQKIGFIRKLLGLDAGDTYYEMLLDYGIESSKDLTDSQAQEFLNRLKNMAIGAGVYKPRINFVFKSLQFEDLANRDGMATPKQLRKIEAMWVDVSVKTQPEDIKRSLNSFIKRITGKGDIKFVEQNDVQKIIKALSEMKAKRRNL